LPQIEIRASWETRNTKEPSVESVPEVPAAAPEPEPEPEPEVKPIAPEVPRTPKLLHRSKSIHSSGRSESRTDLRKSSLPHISFAATVPPDLFKKKAKKGRALVVIPQSCLSLLILFVSLRYVCVRTRYILSSVLLWVSKESFVL
jgi:hypothetical protein